jgi:serine/threonine protein kinase
VSVTTQPGGPPPTAAPPFQPEPFGKYVLVDRIATGGMAEIFKAKSFSHGGFESLLVIKRILPHIGDNAEFIEMFQDEAKVSVALQHPNIVRIFDFGRIQSGNVAHWFIVMECVDGKDVRNLLRKLARRKEFMPPELSAYVALEACKGLFYAHTKTDTKGNPFGIVHRDISPSNILLSYEGEVKIADFGIAKAESNAYQTRDGVLKGKFEYMSPEQAQGVEFDHRSDLFSLGILLWETLTGRRLFKTESETATLTKVREARIDSPDAIKSDLPPRLVQICMKALSKEPGDRYATAAEMEQDLRDFLFPETSDTIKARFREFLAGLFAEEHAEERRRLESTEPAVAALRERLVAEWETQHDVTMSRVTQTTVQQVVPWVAAIALAMLGAFAVAVAVVVGFVVLRPDPEPDTQGIQAQPSDRTVLNIVVVPTARIWVNGELRETSKGLVLEDLQPGTYLVKLEAEGYQTVEESVTVEAGTLVNLTKALEPVPTDVPAPTPNPDVAPAEPTGPPLVDFKSSPAGAAVLVDGAQVCVTPCTWKDADEGGSYQIEMKLDGYSTGRSSLRGVRKGTQKVSLVLDAPSAPTQLTVTLMGVGWANVYVDGVKLPKTAPFAKIEVKPGRHEIKVENPAAGFVKTETATFAPGQVTTLRFAP